MVWHDPPLLSEQVLHSHKVISLNIYWSILGLFEKLVLLPFCTVMITSIHDLIGWREKPIVNIFMTNVCMTMYACKQVLFNQNFLLAAVNLSFFSSFFLLYFSCTKFLSFYSGRKEELISSCFSFTVTAGGLWKH